ncbi:MAG TPA: hypothetical protein VFM02_01780 [Candidatus Paceibacterota bacterium]|nr:hypothetical protein [Candidatus Paceibacterota bacterium]
MGSFFKSDKQQVRQFGSKDTPFQISIPNTYGEIDEIRLVGGKNITPKVIWKRSQENGNV